MSGAKAQDIELEHQNRDLERAAPPERRLTWYNNLVSAVSFLHASSKTTSNSLQERSQRGLSQFRQC
jgi:hypothetical protein